MPGSLLSLAHYDDHLYGVCAADDGVYVLPLACKPYVWQKLPGPALRSIAIGGAICYGVSNDRAVVLQPLASLAQSSEWTLASKGFVLSLAVTKDGQLYAVGQNGHLYKQALDAMTPATKWQEIQLEKGQNQLTQIAIDSCSDAIYAIRKGPNWDAQGLIYKKRLSRVKEEPWQLTVAGQRPQAFTVGAGVMYIVFGETIYWQHLHSMTLESAWVELGQATLALADCEDEGSLGAVETASGSGNPWDGMTNDFRSYLPNRPSQSPEHHSISEEVAETHGHALRLQSAQIAILREVSSGVKRLDPAQNANAEHVWQGQMQWCPVVGLWHTHSQVSSVFRNGKHRGQRVQHLTTQLSQGAVVPDDLPPLVAVHHRGHLWVVFGNRRLKALKQYAAMTPEPGKIQVRVIVHDLSGDDRLQLFAKFVLAATTRNPSSPMVPFREPGHRQWPGFHTGSVWNDPAKSAPWGNSYANWSWEPSCWQDGSWWREAWWQDWRGECARDEGWWS